MKRAGMAVVLAMGMGAAQAMPYSALVWVWELRPKESSLTNPVPEVATAPPAKTFGEGERDPMAVDWDVPKRFQGKTISKRAPFEDKVIALTFDDGPDPHRTPIVLDALKKHNMKATFFVLGWRATRYPQLVKRIFDEGHTVANHTYMHPAKPSKAAGLNEILKTQEAIKKACGKYPTIFRPPYGIRESWSAKMARHRLMPSVIWTMSSGDTAVDDSYKVYRNVVFTPRPGDVVLLHDIQPDTADAIGRITDELAAGGWQSITLDDYFRRWDAIESARESQPKP